MEKFRAWLVLARASNLPTVWSNCIAGCWLGGWNNVVTVVLLCAAGTLFYTGGMFLNDVCDVDFDRRHKPDRPIVAGHISRHQVTLAAAALLLCGLLLALAIRPNVALFGALLVILITTYDIVHKHVSWAPWLMAGCRFVLYLTAAAAGAFGVTIRALGFAIALALYVVGLSYFARGESIPQSSSRRWLLLVSAPLLIGVYFDFPGLSMICALPLLLWICYALGVATHNVSRAVAALLAGIVLVDLLAVSPLSLSVWAVFAGLFGAALLFQRYVPAT